MELLDHLGRGGELCEGLVVFAQEQTAQATLQGNVDPFQWRWRSRVYFRGPKLGECILNI